MTDSDKKITPAEKFDEANRNFKQVFRGRFKKPIGPKYRYLHNWTLQKSKYLLNDERCYSGNKKVYQRGAIVNVDFGVNIGTELSGNHFAIILNKKDTPRNDKLTVIPLTSHQHPHTIELSDTIKTSSLDEFRKTELSALLSLYSVIYLRHEALIAIGKKSDTSPKDFLNSVFEGIEDDKGGVEFIEYMKGSTTNQIKNKEDAIVFLKTNTDFYDTENYDDDPLFNSALSKLSEMVLKLNDVLNRYELYNKTTYAKAVDITTISKARLMKINKYDPIGKMKVSNDVLDAIDNEIHSLFLH
ncbi:type II toxin-antitoxin system PemK/MazF family toxin [Latilactobacillus curvatus]|uniref:type II toxin-antitoxin system PemK/MazF family toxin n=1 Tax=Latilactobacillus curvatus TaxID=28038 RepID=UPI00217E6A7E|nr:type II toxin-antitoxin system PemK/MazF family toxin [Latilactobacillus curvatus]MCS6143408.1 type II toxin-antitoxin system PemK/MazF family toxin [Latilactobacillus curvatus]